MDILDHHGWLSRFARREPPHENLRIKELQYLLDLVCFNIEGDCHYWRFQTSGDYSIRSLHHKLISNNRIVWEHHNKVGNPPAPNKINYFMWLLLNGKILTKDNLIKRGWQGDPLCNLFSSS